MLVYLILLACIYFSKYNPIYLYIKIEAWDKPGKTERKEICITLRIAQFPS